MTSFQRDLFNKKVTHVSLSKSKTLKKSKTKRGGKTKNQLAIEGRNARDSIERTLAKIAEILDDFPKPEHCDNIIAQIEYIKTTHDYKTLQDCQERNVGSWITRIDDFSSFLIRMCNLCKTNTGRQWVKFKSSYEIEKKFKTPLYYTCCGIHVRGSNWVVMSNRGQMRCRKHFVSQFGRQFTRTKEVDPLSEDFPISF